MVPAEAKAESTLRAPQAEYALRLQERRTRAAALARTERLLGWARVGVFLLALALASLAFGPGWVSGWWPLVLLVVFGGLVYRYGQVERDFRRANRAVGFYERGVARLADQWPGTGESGARFLDPDHPYAADLDLFGDGSVFQRLCSAQTRGGEDTLAGWLLRPADGFEVHGRQAAVDELRQGLDLREDLDGLGAGVRAAVDPKGLAAWGRAPVVLDIPWARWLALLLALLGVTTLVGWQAGDLGRVPFLAVVFVELVFAAWLRERVRQVIAGVDRRARDLAVLAGLLARLEREQFTCATLRELREALDIEGQPPSVRVGQLGVLIDRLNWRRNQLFAPIGALLLWGTQHAFALEAWRQRSGNGVARWLEVVAKFEALGALAGYAYENPADPFPEVVSDGPLFDGEELGHPLIPVARCVRNTVKLGEPVRVLLVSGSNMSGKSTLLRTVGVNAVLALAGAPVRAQKLRLSPLTVGATLRVQDSLQAGRSRFYAEVTRVRSLVEVAKGRLPLLFLLDELFQGTNSHDRRLGGEAVVRGLVEAGAIGLVTTHDLALTHIADRLGPRAANVHFEDHFENGVMTFDYRMRPGVVQKSNALALMRAVGLEV